MSPNKKKKWLAAMRGGKYRHRTGILTDGKCFCALGVLADISPGVFEKKTSGEMLPVYFSKKAERIIYGVLEDEDLKALGLTREQGQTIIYYNDTSKNYDKVIDYVKNYV